MRRIYRRQISEWLLFSQTVYLNTGSSRIYISSILYIKKKKRFAILKLVNLQGRQVRSEEEECDWLQFEVSRPAGMV